MSIHHSQFHSKNAFCGTVGPEELQHLGDLLEELTDGQLRLLVENCGISLESDEREDYIQVMDEVDREDFYREYRSIVKNNVCLMTEE